MTGKRFILTFDDNIVDNLTGITHNVHSGYDVTMDLTGLLNTLHEENEQLKTKNNAYIQDIEVFKEENTHLKLENDELRSIKKFAEIHGINIFKIDEAFQKCWNDNGKLIKENEQLKIDNKWLLKCIENQSILIQELDSIIMAHNMEHKITIKLTKKDLKTLDKALSYYTHEKVEE